MKPSTRPDLRNCARFVRLKDISFCALTKDHLEAVYAWRSSQFVSQFMLTQLDKDYSNHIEWFDRVAHSSSCRYWLIKIGSVPVGVANLANIDFQTMECSAGYYIGNERFRSLGVLPLPYLYNYVFRVRSFRRLYGQVRVENQNIRKIHQMHGYTESAVHRIEDKMTCEKIDVVSVELLSENWLAKREYAGYIAPFGE
jgi:UDP-4-amino-4,6-dideoxy-N-acetyl-beta-L-altrosamine N-acetyltransferase